MFSLARSRGTFALCPDNDTIIPKECSPSQVNIPEADCQRMTLRMARICSGTTFKGGFCSWRDLIPQILHMYQQTISRHRTRTCLGIIGCRGSGATARLNSKPSSICGNKKYTSSVAPLHHVQQHQFAYEGSTSCCQSLGPHTHIFWYINNDPGRTRTCNPRLRRHLIHWATGPMK